MTCSTCISYLTDEDENGNVVGFHHDRNIDFGFCAMRDLFYTVGKDEQPCEMYEFDGGEKWIKKIWNKLEVQNFKT